MLNMLPNIPSFDAANMALFLHPAHKEQAQKAASQSLPSPNPAPDINSITSVLLLQMLANLSSSGTCSPSTATVPTAPALTMPVHHVLERSASLPVPSPSKLMRFLRYAETELHVENATAFEQRLAAQHIGPDILPEIEDKILAMEIGILAGDIVHLKKGSITWWNGPEAKRKHRITDQSSASQPGSPMYSSSQEKCCLREEVHWWWCQPLHQTSNDSWGWWQCTKGLRSLVWVYRSWCLASCSERIYCLWGWRGRGWWFG